ncbi:MAG: transposase [Methylobacterium sp.]|nr:transposase [Methylobacterium sp.]
MDTTGTDLLGRRRRRRHSGEFKETVIRECMVAGVSIASVALRHGLNANMLRKWVIEAEHRLEAPRQLPERNEAVSVESGFVPVPIAETTSAAAPLSSLEGEIRIEMRREGVTLNVNWPVSAARDCAAWLREWLR